MRVVVVSSTAMVIAMRAMNMDVEVVRILKLSVDVMVLLMGTVDRIILRLLNRSRIKLLVVMVGSMLVVADTKVRAHPKHVEDICWIHICLLRNRLLLVCEHALPVFSEILTFKVIGDVLITMRGMSLVRGEETVLITWIKSA